MGGAAVGDQLIGNAFGLVDRNRKAEADRSALRFAAGVSAHGCDRGVDPHQLAVQIDQRAPELPGLIAASVWMASSTVSWLPACPR